MHLSLDVTLRSCLKFIAGMWLILFCSYVPADVLNAQADFHIPPQPLENALLNFSKQVNIQVLMDANEVKGILSQGVSGTYRTGAALDELLGQTGFEYELSGPNTITIHTRVTQQDTESKSSADSSKSRASDDPPTRIRRVLEEIIITAQRRAENLQDVNLAISAFTQHDLDRMGANNIERLDLLTPGFEWGQFGSGPRLSIRGLGRANFEANTDGAVGSFVNGIYRGRGQQTWLAMVDVERVEITRGPQGTLYGRNTTGGNINVITKKPDDEFEAFGDVMYGNYHHILTRATLNVPLSDTFQARASVLYENHDGFVDNANPSGNDLLDEDQVYFQGALRWMPTADLEIIARGHYWNQGGNGYAFSGHKLRNLAGENNSVVESINTLCDAVLFPVFGLDALVGTNACTPGRSTGVAANDLDPYNIDYDFPSQRDVKEWGISTHINWDFNNVRFTSITSYTNYFQFSEGDVDFSDVPAWISLIREDVQTFSQEAHLSSIATDPLEWLVGFYYLDDEVDELFSNTLVSFPAQLVDPRLAVIGSNVGSTGLTRNYRDAKARTESWAVFGQATYSVTDQIRITGGIRYTEDEKSYEQTDIDPGQRSLPPSSKTFSETTWLAGIDWSWTDDNMVYFTASTGFRAGFFNRYTTILPGQTDSVGPETIDNYEFGSKNRFFDDRLQANLAIFWNDISNAHTYTFDTSVPTSVGTGAGKAETWGAELEIQAVATDRLSVTATVAYLDAIYVVYKDFTDGTPGNLIDVSGHKREHSPEWTASFTAAYNIPLGDWGVLTPYVQWAYKDDYYVTALNDAFLDHQESFSQTDFRLLWESSDGHWNIEAFIQNIEDNGVIVGGFYAFGGVWTTSGPEPRTFGTRIGYRH